MVLGEGYGLARPGFMVGTRIWAHETVCSQINRTCNVDSDPVRFARRGDLPVAQKIHLPCKRSHRPLSRPSPIRGLRLLPMDHVQRWDDGTAWSVGPLSRSARHRIAAAPPTSTAEARLGSCAPMPASIMASARPRAAKYPAKAAGAANSAIPAKRSESARELDRSSTRTSATIAPPRPVSAEGTKPS